MNNSQQWRGETFRKGLYMYLLACKEIDQGTNLSCQKQLIWCLKESGQNLWLDLRKHAASRRSKIIILVYIFKTSNSGLESRLVSFELHSLARSVFFIWCCILNSKWYTFVLILPPFFGMTWLNGVLVVCKCLHQIVINILYNVGTAPRPSIRGSAL